MSRPGAELRPVDEQVIAHVVANVREADRLEFEAIRGVDVEQELRNALEQSEEAFVLVSRGEPVVIFGCIRYDDRIGVPWMISTHAVTRHRAAFLQECRDQIGRMRQRYAALINYTDARYEQALRFRRNAFNQAFGLVTQGNEGIRQARADYRTRRLNAFSSLLSGGSQAVSNYKALS